MTTQKRMSRHDFLRALHRVARPRNYLEIGVNDGRSLALSRVPSIAVDPEFKITVPLRCDLHLVKATSDDFFARPDPIVHLRSGRNPVRNLRRGRPPFGHWIGEGPTLDLAFIDGLHLFEYALRDFMNVERFAHWTSVIVMDDMLPRSIEEASRDRHTKMWAGDVYKVGPVLRKHRPELIVLPMDTTPTGVMVVLGADATSTALHSRYDDLLTEWIVPDPQEVPTGILQRTGAVDPQRFLDSTIIPFLLKHRGRGRGGGMADLRGLASDLAR
jgi:hypothetical protein